jgi:hypothetical protein
MQDGYLHFSNCIVSSGLDKPKESSRVPPIGALVAEFHQGGGFQPRNNGLTDLRNYPPSKSDGQQPGSGSILVAASG